MLTKLHVRPAPAVEGELDPPEIVEAERAIRAAEEAVSVAADGVRLCRLAAALDLAPGDTAQLIADSIKPGATFIETLDAFIEDLGEA